MKVIKIVFYAGGSGRFQKMQTKLCFVIGSTSQDLCLSASPKSCFKAAQICLLTYKK